MKLERLYKHSYSLFFLIVGYLYIILDTQFRDIIFKMLQSLYKIDNSHFYFWGMYIFVSISLYFAIKVFLKVFISLKNPIASFWRPKGLNDFIERFKIFFYSISIGVSTGILIVLVALSSQVIISNIG